MLVAFVAVQNKIENPEDKYKQQTLTRIHYPKREEAAVTLRQGELPPGSAGLTHYTITGEQAVVLFIQ